LRHLGFKVNTLALLARLKIDDSKAPGRASKWVFAYCRDSRIPSRNAQGGRIADAAALSERSLNR